MEADDDERHVVDGTQALLMQLITVQQPNGWPSEPSAQSGVGGQSAGPLQLISDEAAELITEEKEEDVLDGEELDDDVST